MPYLVRHGVTKITVFYTFTVTPLFAPSRGGKILVLLRKTFSHVPLSSLIAEGNSFLNYVIDTLHI